MATLADLIVRIGADATDFEKHMGKVERSLNKTGGQLQSIGKKLSIGITAPIMGLATTSLVMAGDFEKSMNRVGAVSGATGDDFDALKEQAKELGITTQYSASQAADAMGFLAMAGFKADEILGAMPSTLQLAASAQIDLARAADITTNILTGYGLEVENLGHANDVLVKAMISTNVDLEMLGESLKYVGPVASGVGLQFEEVTAAIGMMGNAGIQGSMAGTALRGAISRLINPTDSVAAKLGALNVEVFDASGNIRPLVEIVHQLERAGATTADMMVIFGDRAGPAMAALVDQGTEALAGLTAELEASGGTADRIAKQQMQGLQGSITALKSAFAGFMIAISESGLIDWVTSLTQKLTSFVQGLAETDPALLKVITGIALAAAAIGPLLIGLGTVIKTLSGVAGASKLVGGGFATLAGLGGRLVEGFSLWSGGAATFGEALSFVAGGPTGLIIAGIAAVIAIGVTLWKHWDEISGWLVVAWESISETAISVWNSIASFLTGTWENIRAFFTDTWSGIKKTFDDVFGNMVRSALDFGKGIMESLRKGIGSIKLPLPRFGIEWKSGPLGVKIPSLDIGVNWKALGDIVPFLGDGGIVTRPTLAVIGEKGPEAVLPLGRTGASAAMGGSMTIIIEMDGRQVARSVLPHVPGELARVGVR